MENDTYYAPAVPEIDVAATAVTIEETATPETEVDEAETSDSDLNEKSNVTENDQTIIPTTSTPARTIRKTKGIPPARLGWD